MQLIFVEIYKKIMHYISVISLSFIASITVVQEKFSYGNKDYYFGNQLVTYENAEYECTQLSLDAKLVIIQNKTIQQFLQITINSRLTGNFSKHNSIKIVP